MVLVGRARVEIAHGRGEGREHEQDEGEDREPVARAQQGGAHFRDGRRGRLGRARAAAGAARSSGRGRPGRRRGAPRRRSRAARERAALEPGVLARGPGLRPSRSPPPDRDRRGRPRAAPRPESGATARSPGRDLGAAAAPSFGRWVIGVLCLRACHDRAGRVTAPPARARTQVRAARVRPRFIPRRGRKQTPPARRGGSSQAG
jgi:hypothetical protein